MRLTSWRRLMLTHQNWNRMAVARMSTLPIAKQKTQSQSSVLRMIHLIRTIIIKIAYCSNYSSCIQDAYSCITVRSSDCDHLLFLWTCLTFDERKHASLIENMQTKPFRDAYTYLGSTKSTPFIANSLVCQTWCISWGVHQHFSTK